MEDHLLNKQSFVQNPSIIDYVTGITKAITPSYGLGMLPISSINLNKTFGIVDNLAETQKRSATYLEGRFDAGQTIYNFFEPAVPKTLSVVDYLTEAQKRSATYLEGRFDAGQTIYNAFEPAVPKSLSVVDYLTEAQKRSATYLEGRFDAGQTIYNAFEPAVPKTLSVVDYLTEAQKRSATYLEGRFDAGQTIYDAFAGGGTWKTIDVIDYATTIQKRSVGYLDRGFKIDNPMYNAFAGGGTWKTVDVIDYATTAQKINAGYLNFGTNIYDISVLKPLKHISSGIFEPAVIKNGSFLSLKTSDRENYSFYSNVESSKTLLENDFLDVVNKFKHRPDHIGFEYETKGSRPINVYIIFMSTINGETINIGDKINYIIKND